MKIMAKAKQAKSVLKGGRSEFHLVGRVKVNDYTFTLDTVSDKSGYQYSRLNLGIEIDNGATVYVSNFGGFYPNEVDKYGNNKPNMLYGNDKDDFKSQVQVGWVDRFDDDILGGLNGMNFIQVGIELDGEQDENSKVYKVKKQKFLSPYDAIQYISDHLSNGDVVNVRGDIKYSKYNGEVKRELILRSIYLSKATPEEFKGDFKLMTLLNKESIDKSSIDLEKCKVNIYANVVGYAGNINGTKYNTNLAIPQMFELSYEGSKKDQFKNVITKYFKVKKDITELTVEGRFVSSVETSEMEVADMTDELSELIELGLCSEEEIMAKVVSGGSSEAKMIITRPAFEKVGENKLLKILHTPERYKEEEVWMWDNIVKDSTDEEDNSSDDEDAKEDINDILNGDSEDANVDDSDDESDEDWLSGL